MKKIITFIAAVIVGITFAQAQTQQDSLQTQDQSWQSGPVNYQNYPTKDMRKLSSNEIPESLRTTLQGPEYANWEKGALYFNSSTNEYFYQSGSNSSNGLTDSPTDKKRRALWYRFDSKGKRLRDQKQQN